MSGQSTRSDCTVRIRVCGGTPSASLTGPSNGQESRFEAQVRRASRRPCPPSLEQAPDPQPLRLQEAQETRVFLRRRQGGRQPHHEGPARRQGRRPRRDDQRRAAGAARIHDLHRGLQHLLQGESGRFPPRSTARSTRNLRKLEKAAGATLGSTDNPLLVSVRSGAKFSMPGMMDTILNLGLNDEAVEGLKRADGERPVRLRQLPPLHPDVRQRRPGDSEGRVRARVRRA